MPLSEYLKIALSSLMANKTRTLLTMLGIIIGIAAVIALVSLGEGTRTYVSGQIEGLGSHLLFVISGKELRQRPTESTLHPRDYEDIAKLSALDKATAIIERIGEIRAGKEHLNTTIIGADENYPYVRDWDVEKGRFFTYDESRGQARICVLGQEVAHKLFGGVSPLGDQVSINGYTFTVVGVMAEKGHIMDINLDDTVFLPLVTAQKLFDANFITAIILKARKAEEVRKLRKQVDQTLFKNHRVKDFIVASQEEILSVFGSVLKVLTYLIAGIAGISLLVGGIGIMNIMLVTVTERTREIGLRKAVGANFQDIFLQFLAESVLVSLLGGSIGILLGVTGAKALAQGIHWEATISLWAILLSFSSALIVGLVSGIYPALRAARLDPIASLHYE